jgi:hypothetical protein
VDSALREGKDRRRRQAPSLPEEGERAHLFGQLLRILMLALALSVAIAALDLQGPDPDVSRHVLSEPSEQEWGPAACAPFC